MNENYKQFDVPQEQIDEMVAINKTIGIYLNTIADFINWASANVATIDIGEWYDIYQDFVQSNGHIIEKINKIRSPSYKEFHPPCLSKPSYYY